MKIIVGLKQKRLIRYMLACCLCLCLVGQCFSAIAEGNGNAPFLEVQSMTVNAEGRYTAQAVLSGFGGELTTQPLFKLTVVIALSESALTVDGVGVYETDAVALTAQPVNGAGEPNGPQKTIYGNTAVALPEGSSGVKLSYFSSESDFERLPTGFQTGRVVVDIGGEIAEPLNSESVIGMLQATGSASVSDAAAQQTELFTLQASLIADAQAPVETTQTTAEKPGPSDLTCAAKLTDGALAAGVSLSLTTADGQTLSGLTDAQGTVIFENVAPGAATLAVMPPEGVLLSAVGGEPAQNGKTYHLTIAGNEMQTLEILCAKSATIIGGASSLGEGIQVALASVDMQSTAGTAADGSFHFDDLPAGDYNVYVQKPAGKTPSENSAWQLSQQGDMIWLTLKLEAGQRYELPEIAFAALVSIEGCAYADGNGNLVREDGEPLMSGVAVRLERLDGGVWTSIATAVTDAYGKYAFQQGGAGDFRVCAQSDAADFYVAAVGDTAQYNGKTAYGQTIALRDGERSEGAADISLQTPASLHAIAFADKNANGVRDAGDRGVPGMTVQVMDGEAAIASGATGANGEALLGGVRPGLYSLRMTAPDGYGFTVKGPNPLNGDSCVGDSQNGAALSDPLEFASGRTAAAAAGLTAVGSFSGKVFEDLNNDGVMDPNDPGVAGVALRLTGIKSGRVYELTTDETGLYKFSRLPDERYLFSAVLPEGMLFARYSKTGGDLRSVFSGAVVTREFGVKNGEAMTDKNVGVVENGVLMGKAFLDLNYSGYFDEGEPGYAGVTIEAIKLSNSESMGKTVTAEDGSFRLEGLRGGDYRLRAILPADGSIFTAVPSAGGENANFFEQRSSRRENSIQPVKIISGGEVNALVGVAVGASVKGTVFQDANYNGRLDNGEKPLSGVTAQIVDGVGNVAATAVTDAKGQYVLKGILPGSYTVMIKRVNGSGFTRLRPNEEGGSHVVELLNDYGRIAPMDVAMGQTIEGINAGMLPSATVTGCLFNDVNDDGLLTLGEQGLAGASVRLKSGDGEIDLTRTVGEDGTYFFDGVMPGSYTLTYLLPEHTEIARVAAGGNTLENQGHETATDAFDVAMGENYTYPLVGAVILGNFEGVVFNDSNGDGVEDDGERGLSGAVVTLTPDKAGVEEQTVKSGKDGAYALEGLRPAGWKLSVTLPDGYILSHELASQSLTFDAVNAQTLSCPWSTLVNRESKPIGAVKPASVQGVVWLDENKDGSRARDEALMSGIMLELVNESTGRTVARTQTTQDGFLFENIRPGTYTVRFALPQQSQPANDKTSTFAYGSYMQQTGVVLTEGQKLEGLTTGLVSQTSVGGKLWLEEGGVKSPVAGVDVSLWRDGDSAPIATMATGESGDYEFGGLWPDDYILKAALPTGMVFVRPDDPNFEAGASVIGAMTNEEGVSERFSLKMAQHMLDQNIIYIRPAKVGDQVWLDENQNGLIDGEEAKIPGVKLTLMQNGKAVYETTSNEYGYYLFDAVYPGAYILRAEAYPELTPTISLEKLRVISSCLTSGDGKKAVSDEFSVESGSNNMNFKAGYILVTGQQLPGAIATPEGRDWSVTNQKYTDMQED